MKALSDIVASGFASNASAFAGGGGGGLSATSVDCDFGNPGKPALSVDVSDGSAVTSQKVVTSISGSQPAGVDFDELEMDPIMVAASVPANGTVRLRLISINGSPITGLRRVMYALAA